MTCMKIETTIESLGESLDGGVNFSEGESHNVVIEKDYERDCVVLKLDDKEFSLETIEGLVNHMKYLEGVA